MRILVTGAAGMLGRDLVRAVVAAGHEALPFRRADLDITDTAAVERAVSHAGAEVVINCAAWTEVDAAEGARQAALEVNGAGAANVAGVARAAGAWTIHISSDYVFDGGKREPYVESDSVHPLSAYGESKLAGEREVAHAAPEAHTVIRSSWLFGHGGPCFPATILRAAAERDELTVVDDQVGCPTFTGHLAGALVEIASSPPLGIVHLAGAGACSWYELADELIAAAGLDCRLRPGSTEELGRPAPRPRYSVLGTERAEDAPQLPDWRSGVREYLAAEVAV